VLRAALKATKAGGKLELLVENGEFFRTLALAYREGERYPRLEREAATPDVLAAIVRPLVPPAKAGVATGAE